VSLGAYHLWSEDRGTWCDWDIVGEKSYAAAIRGLLPDDWDGESIEVRRDFELVPEPNNPHDEWAISVRADGRTAGYLPREECRQWAGVVRRVVASGCRPLLPGRVYAYEADSWEVVDRLGNPTTEMRATVQLKRLKPETALPLNDPPNVPYTMLPRSAIVQVTKEDQHTGTLLNFVPPNGYGLLFVTLREYVEPRGNTDKPVVEVCIDGQCVGQLTPQMGQRFLPMIRHLEARGLATACWGDITGSAVAAEVRIDAVKANEADATVLDGEPVTIDELLAARHDPINYNLGPVVRVDNGERESPSPPGTHQRTEIAGQRPAPLPPPGWYEDPHYPRLIRYWDGAAWTEHTAPRAR
jgi:hypothetical protein